jgi:predicted ferric reductase
MKKSYKLLLILLIIASVAPFSLVLTTVDYRLFSTDLNAFWLGFAFKFSAFAGYAGAMLFVWQMALGNRFLVRLITPDLVWVNKLHQWIGKYGVLLVFLHPSLMMYAYGESLLWLVAPKEMSQIELQIGFGRFAYQLFLIIFVTSALVRGRLRYRPWKYIHYLAYPMMAYIFAHAINLGTNFIKFPALQALWFTLLTFYALLFVHRLLVWAGLFKTKYELIDKQKQPGDIWTLKLKPVKMGLVPDPGQYFNVQFKPFGESHPFSVLSFSPDTQEINFGIKAVGRFTKRIEKLQTGQVIRLDGPYGVFTREGWNTTRPKVIIAGGIGVTPFYEFIKRYAAPQTYMFNCNFKLENALMRDEFVRMLGDQYFDFISDEQISTQNVISGQINQEHIARILSNSGLNPNQFDYFICGSPSLMKGLKAMLKNLQVKPQQIHTEEFSY